MIHAKGPLTTYRTEELALGADGLPIQYKLTIPIAVTKEMYVELLQMKKPVVELSLYDDAPGMMPVPTPPAEGEFNAKANAPAIAGKLEVKGRGKHDNRPTAPPAPS
jgi:hypothetical protein